jgi:hypothetical protein
METPIIRQGRYTDSRTDAIFILTGWSDHTVVFNGNTYISIEDFKTYFRLATSED